MNIKAIKHETNTLSIAIVDIEYGIEDKVKFKWLANEDVHGWKESEVFEETIQYEDNGRAYFIVENEVFYLDEFVKI